MSIIDPPAGWDDVDGINTNERLLGGPSGPLNRAATGLAARVKWLRDRQDQLALEVETLQSYVTDTPVQAPADGSDVTALLNSIVAAGRAPRLLRGGVFNVAGPVVATTGCEINFEPGVIINGTGVGPFVIATSGSVRIQGRGTLNGFSQVVAFTAGAALEELVLRDITQVGTVNTTAAARGSLVNDFNADRYIRKIEVTGCSVKNGREGFLFRGTWQFAQVSNCDFDGVQHYSIRLGQDREADVFSLQGHSQVVGNRITNMRNPLTGGGSNECDGIAVWGQSTNVQLNYLQNIDSAGVDDCEGIYTKVRHGLIGSNILVDCGRREGSIVMKGVPAEPGTTYVQNFSIQCYDNLVWFTLSRSNECSISIQAHNVDCFGNWVTAGTGVTSESAAIVVKYRNPYRNIRIRGNVVNLQGANSYGILVWAYGENVTIVNNRVYGAGSQGIRLETRSPSDVRHPGVGNVIGKSFVVEGNEVYAEAVGAVSGITRGIAFAFSNESVVTDVRIRGNEVRGPISEYGLAIQATGSSGWTLENNDFANITGSTAAVQLFTVPGNFRVARNVGLVSRARGQDTMSSASSTKTTATGIQTALAAFMISSDIQISPINEPGASRLLYISSTGASGSFVVTAATASASTAGFVWSATVEDRLLNPV